MNLPFGKIRIALLILAFTLIAGCSTGVDVAGVRGSFGDFDVVLLSTSTCGYCKKLRADLAEWGVDYVDIDIESERKGRDAYEQLNGRGVPILLIGDQVVHGYSPKRSRALMVAANLLTAASTP